MIRWLATLALVGRSPARPPPRTAAPPSATPAPSRRPPAARTDAGGGAGRPAGRLRRGRPRPQRRGDRAGHALVPGAALRAGAAGRRHRPGRRRPLDLAREYAALAAGRRVRWTARIAAPRFSRTPGDRLRFNRDVLRLAGPPETAAQACAGAGGPRDCAALATADLADRRAAGPRALAGGPRAPSRRRSGSRRRCRRRTRGPGARAALAQVCAAYPAGGPAALVAEVQRLGEIAAAAPGAARDPRLAGVRGAGSGRARRCGSAGCSARVPAVVRLLAEYYPRRRPPRRRWPNVPGCTPRRQATMPDLFALDPADLEKLAARAALQRGAGAGRRRALRATATSWSRRSTACSGVSRADCGAAPGPGDGGAPRGQSDRLQPRCRGAEAPGAGPDLADVLPALAPLAAIESDSREALEAGVEAAVRALGRARPPAAAASRPPTRRPRPPRTSARPRTPRPGHPRRRPRRAEPRNSPSPTPRSLMLQAAVPDDAMLEAISSTPYRPLESRDLVRSDMLNALQPVVAGDRRGQDPRAAGGGAAGGPHALAPRRARRSPTSPRTPHSPRSRPRRCTALASLCGIAYPDERLFEQALATLPVPLDARPARRSSRSPASASPSPTPAAQSRRSPPTAAATSSAGRTRSSTASTRSGASPAAADAAPAQVDFDLVGRIAFDGLRPRRPRLAQLRAAVEGRGRHLHRLGAPPPGQGRPRASACAAGATGPRTRRSWPRATSLDELTPPPRRLERSSPPPAPSAASTATSTARADGVTLIVEGYTGAAGKTPRASRS